MHKTTKWGDRPQRKYKRGGGCSRCGEARDRRGQRYCGKCHNEYQRRTRPKHKDLTPEERRRANCRSYANVYRRRGKLKPMPCLLCDSSENLEMHHTDYTKPLQVIWLCRCCHKDFHKVDS